MGLSMKALAASLRKRSQGPSGSTAPDSCNSHRLPQTLAPVRPPRYNKQVVFQAEGMQPCFPTWFGRCRWVLRIAAPPAMGAQT